MARFRYALLVFLTGGTLTLPAGDPPIIPRPQPSESAATLRNAPPHPREDVRTVRVRGKVVGLEGNDHALIRADGPRRIRTTTRVGGVFELRGLVPGAYTITPYNQRYAFCPSGRRLEVGPKDIENLRFTASPAEPGEPLAPDGRAGRADGDNKYRDQEARKRSACPATARPRAAALAKATP